MHKMPLHIRILLGLVLGVVAGILFIVTGVPPEWVANYIMPLGTIFVNALKMIAMPLVLASLIVGVSNIGRLSKLSRIGGKTIGIYIMTTAIAITIGLSAVNLIQPGKKLPIETREKLMDMYGGEAESTTNMVKEIQDRPPLKPLVDIVPENVFNALGDNSNMLQVVFFALLIGIALLMVEKSKKDTVVNFFDALNDVIIKIVNMIMYTAPVGVFALISGLLMEVAGDDPGQAFGLLRGLLWYMGTVVAGLLFMGLIIYPSLFKIFTKVKYQEFFRGIRPAQLLAFSTSSSAATLPVTMRHVENDLGVSEQVSSFVLPLGATLNMDGTSLYQGVASVFIAQALGMDLSISSQLVILLTATLASIGSAGVPGAGIVMLVIVLESIGVPAAGISLILAPDRLLDMCRTTLNVTGDATVATVVASSEGELSEGFVNQSTKS